MIIVKPHRVDEDNHCEECECTFLECTVCLDLFCDCNQDELDDHDHESCTNDIRGQDK